MRRQETRRKFHDAIVNMLYTRPPSPHRPQQDDSNPVAAASTTTFSSNFDVNSIPDPEDRVESRISSSSSSSSSEDDDRGGSRKLTRAQRKRIRRKKLKEADTGRRTLLIGPLLPSTKIEGGDQCSVMISEPDGVRQNAAEEKVANAGNPIEEPQECVALRKKTRSKQRRMAKKRSLPRKSLKSCMENWR
ncbi:hypothetical protein Dimus_017262 [Dionaea muscipula]